MARVAKELSIRKYLSGGRSVRQYAGLKKERTRSFLCSSPLWQVYAAVYVHNARRAGPPA
eukprot:jgi/Botrbrau1/22520/Bobra.114_2s0045.1